jgi:hypothetical protein
MALLPFKAKAWMDIPERTFLWVFEPFSHRGRALPGAAFYSQAEHYKPTGCNTGRPRHTRRQIYAKAAAWLNSTHGHEWASTHHHLAYDQLRVCMDHVLETGKPVDCPGTVLSGNRRTKRKRPRCP